MASDSAYGFWGSVLSGIGKAVTGKNNKKSSDKQFQYENILRPRETGNEERKTLLYQTLLANWTSKQAKYDKSKGLSNYVSYARAQSPGSSPSLNNMLQYNSPNQIQDPGAAPSFDPYNSSLQDKLKGG
jgi:hypothetical protein